MEQFYDLFLMLLFVVIVSHFILFYKHRSPFTAPNLPPGRMGYPVIGESLSYLSSGWKGYPEKFIYDRMAKYSSSQVFKTSLFLQPTVMFCGSACNKFLFSNENKLVKLWLPEAFNKIFPSSLQTSSNEEAMRMRRMLPHFLNTKSLQRYVGIMDSIAQTHFASDWENKTQVTVFPLARRYTFWLACRLFMSVEDPDHVAKFQEPFDKIISGLISMPIDLPGTPLNRAVKASRFVREELLKIIKQRKVDLADGKASPTQDILSHMLLTCDEYGQYLNEDSIADKILGLLVAGHDTASSTCALVVKFLAELPQNIYQRVYQEQMEIVKSKSPGELLDWHDIEKMKYSWNVAREVMRLAPPVQGTFREAINDFVFNGFSIPKGWKLHWSAYSTHRNPECFPEPEKFDPGRFDGNGPAPYTYVPFGGGPRMCPGREYARMEILVFIHNLMKRFKWQMLIPNEKIVATPTSIPAKGLPVLLYPHQA